MKAKTLAVLVLLSAIGVVTSMAAATEYPEVRGLCFVGKSGFAFVSIDGVTVRAAVGAKVGTFTILEIADDSVRFRSDAGQEKTIYIGNGTVKDGAAAATDFAAQDEFRAVMAKVLPGRPDVTELLIELGLRTSHFIVSQDSPGGAAILFRGPVRVYLGVGPCVIERVTPGRVEVIRVSASGERQTTTAERPGEAFKGLPIPTFLQ